MFATLKRLLARRHRPAISRNADEVVLEVRARAQGRDPTMHLETTHRIQLEELRPNARAVLITKPQPWQPAVEIVALHNAGMDVQSIAKKTGYSVPSVRRALETRGMDSRVGPQCDRWAGREFTIDEALAEMPLPCGPSCICSYHPIFKWE